MELNTTRSRVICLTSDQEAVLEKAERLIYRLTNLEEQIAKLAASGLSTKEIAAHLGNSQKTVDRHIESITRKARLVYGSHATFRSCVVLELRCFYFLTDS